MDSDSAFHRCGEIVVNDARRHCAELLERPHVAVEKRNLVAPLVDPHEVPAPVRQVHQKQPHAVPLPAEVNDEFEEVDLRFFFGTETRQALAQ